MVLRREHDVVRPGGFGDIHELVGVELLRREPFRQLLVFRPRHPVAPQYLAVAAGHGMDAPVHEHADAPVEHVPLRVRRRIRRGGSCHAERDGEEKGREEGSESFHGIAGL